MGEDAWLVKARNPISV